MIELYLIDTNPEVTKAWIKVFEGVENIHIKTDSIFNYPCDALVSPANSFGFMNGGIDFQISKTLGWHIEKRLQSVIREQYFGELLVGQAAIIPTEHSNFPYLISAPTMRTPMTIHRSPNIYLAMKSILLLWKHGKLENGIRISEEIKSIAVPGLGTGVGQAPPLFCARCMRIAWEDVMQDKFSTIEGWEELRSNWAYFYTHEKEDLKYIIP